MLALIADIHSNLEALKAVLDALKEQKPSEILCLGDIVGYGANPREVIRLLRAHRIHCIQGNHDLHAATLERLDWFNADAAAALRWTNAKLGLFAKRWLARLPKTTTVNGLFLVHGSPADPLYDYVWPTTPERRLDELLRLAKTPALAMGHTHQPFVRRLHGCTVLNAGSVGQPRDGDPRAAFVLLEQERGEPPSIRIVRVDYEVERAAQKIVEAGLPPFLAARLYQGA